MMGFLDSRIIQEHTLSCLVKKFKIHMFKPSAQPPTSHSLVLVALTTIIRISLAIVPPT